LAATARTFPPATKSFIVTAYDPDAPTGSGLWHWSAFNIPVSVTGLEEGVGSVEGAMPEGSVTGRNDFSHNQYDGACPPEGSTHHYVITVFAMPMDSLPLDATASSAIVGYFANTASLERASVTVSYGR
jgi:Raf kinase inhibitor-like YbhB/YbcL family protein